MKRHSLSMVKPLLVALVFCANGCSNEEPLTHVLLISMDTTRVDHLDVYGYELTTAPVLTRLVKSEGGVRFDRAYTPSPWTLPAHASLMSGLLPEVHGATFRDEKGLAGSEPLISRFPPQYQTLAESFSSKGYATGGFVSGPFMRREFGLVDGFHTYDDELDFGTRSSFQKRLGEFTADRAMSWMKEHEDEPKFTFVHFFDPHRPFIIPPKFAKNLDDFGSYDRGIRYMSEQIDRLFSTLKEIGEWESTLIIVVSDHGESLGDRHPTGIEHGHAQSLYEEVVRAAMIVRWPGREMGASQTDELVSLIDVAPTLADVFDLEGIEGQGRSLSPLWAGKG